jgi:hypothetical protein
MPSDFSIMLQAKLADRRFWIFYFLACVTALLWIGFSATQGMMIFLGLFITLAVISFSVIFCVMLITKLKNDAMVVAALNLSVSD